jgi:serine protease AprX
MSTTTAAPTPTLARWRVVAAALAAALVAAMLAAVPTERGHSIWLIDAGAALPAGAKVLGALPVADALVVAAPSVPGGVPADTPLAPQGTDTFEVAEVAEDFAVDALGEVGAREVDVTGAGALVAVVDTGVAPVDALKDSVAGEIDFTGTGGGDGFGHGTVVASLIAGRDGIAPDAKILSLKVADAEGTVALVSLLDALQWLHSHGRHSGVDVVVTALGVPAEEQAAELLDRAIGRVAQSGRAMIVPTGNEGSETLTSPGTAPAAVAVGATGVDGNEVDFSGRGLDRDGNLKPDVLAPGEYVLGHTPADGAIARGNPHAMRGPEQIRGAGTSLSAALVAGVAALAVSADADPVAVRDELRLGGEPVHAPALVDATSGTAKRTPPGLARKQLTDKVSWNGSGWGNKQWPGASLGGVRWVGVRWVGVRWVDQSWSGVRWVDDSWVGVRWVGVRWVGVRWVGVRWVGVRWVAVWPGVTEQ